jgi:hypothetical protein
MAALLARIARERDKAVAAERVAAEQRDAAEQARNAEREQRDAAEQARNAEQEQRLLAEINLNRVEEQRLRAELQELSNHRLLYAAHINLAMQAWEAIDIKRMRELVESHIRGTIIVWRRPRNGIRVSALCSPAWPRLAWWSWHILSEKRTRRRARPDRFLRNPFRAASSDRCRGNG